jgi:hypothetical protein
LTTTKEQRAEAIAFFRDGIREEMNEAGEAPCSTELIAILDELDARAERIKELEAELDGVKQIADRLNRTVNGQIARVAELEAALKLCADALFPYLQGDESFSDASLKQHQARRAAEKALGGKP